MIQCQRLFPLAVFVTSCFISFLLADTLSASSANSEGGKGSKQSREQPRALSQQQQLKPGLNVAAASELHLYRSLLSDPELAADLALDARSVPRFVGKKDSMWMDRPSRGVPRFVGKKRTNKELGSGDQGEDHRVEKRAAQGYMGKRNYRQYSLPPRGAPYFIGKRYLNYRTSSNTPSSPYLSAQEFKSTFRRTDPFFMGKRTSDLDDPEEETTELGERDTPSFVDLDTSKRGAPRFVGKRGPPRFVGKRGPPRFVGKRGPPRFVGKRGPHFMSELDDDAEEYADFDERDVPMFVDLRAAPRFVGKRGAPRFVGKRGAPRFVGKRGAPRFVGKRGAPRFVGKREEDETDKLYEPRASFDFGGDLSEGAFPPILELIQQREAEDEAAAMRQEAAELILSKLQSAEDAIQAERAAGESHTDDISSGETAR